MRLKKQSIYDVKFQQKKQSARQSLREEFDDSEHSMAIMRYFNQLKMEIMDMAYNMPQEFTTNIQSQSLKKSNNAGEDGSTIVSLKLVPEKNRYY